MGQEDQNPGAVPSADYPEGNPQQPQGQPTFGQQPYGGAQYGQTPSGQQAYSPNSGQQPYPPNSGQQPYGGSPDGGAQHGQPPYGQAPYGQPPYGQPPYGQAPYGQAPYGQQPFGQVPPGYAPKSMVVAILLALFLGTFGIHNFYLGYSQKGIIQLVLTIVGWATSWLIVGVFALIGVAVWVIVDIVQIVTRQGQYVGDSNGVPLQ